MMKDRVANFVRANISAVSFLVIGFIVFLPLAADRLLFVRDVGAVNLNWWVGLFIERFPWWLVLMAPALAFGRFSKWFYMIFAPAFCFLELVEWFVMKNFGMVLDGDWVGIIMGSSWNEFTWFFNQYLSFATVAVAIAVIALLWGVVRAMRLVHNIPVRVATLGSAFLSVCVFIYAISFFKSGPKIFNSLTPVNLVVDSFQNFRSYVVLSKMKKHPQLPPNVGFNEDLKDVVGVFVLGESAARSHWGLYGYGRDTTPNMSRRKNELVVFSDLVTAGGCTTEAMRYLLTTRTVENNYDYRFTLPQVLRTAGCSVPLFTNQERWGEWGGDETFDFSGCEPMVFMCERGETNRYDEILLKYLGESLATNIGKTIVFMHCIGSHFPCDLYYPHENMPFEPEKFDESYSKRNTRLMQNHYDNSMVYTDRFLEGVISALEKRGGSCWMIYLSDHGESPSSKSWRMATDRDIWDIPFVVWMSNEFKEKFPDRAKRLESAKTIPLQSDQLLYGLLDFMGIEGYNVSERENFLSEEFVPRKQRMILSGDRPYTWE